MEHSDHWYEEHPLMIALAARRRTEHPTRAVVFPDPPFAASGWLNPHAARLAGKGESWNGLAAGWIGDACALACGFFFTDGGTLSRARFSQHWLGGTAEITSPRGPSAAAGLLRICCRSFSR